jgi:hypothetical protein
MEIEDHVSQIAKISDAVGDPMLLGLWSMHCSILGCFTLVSGKIGSPKLA